MMLGSVSIHLLMWGPSCPSFAGKCQETWWTAGRRVVDGRVHYWEHMGSLFLSSVGKVWKNVFKRKLIRGRWKYSEGLVFSPFLLLLNLHAWISEIIKAILLPHPAYAVMLPSAWYFQNDLIMFPLESVVNMALNLTGEKFCQNLELWKIRSQ